VVLWMSDEILGQTSIQCENVLLDMLVGYHFTAEGVKRRREGDGNEDELAVPG
jgi:hypothetical protein